LAPVAFAYRFITLGRVRVKDQPPPECESGLPDVIFSYQQYRFANIWQGLGLEHVRMFLHVI
jgi:hypothetical protein